MVEWWSGGVVEWWSVEWWSGGVVEWWSGGVVEWWSGGVVEWWSGGVVEWWSGGVVEWWSGGVVSLDPITFPLSSPPTVHCLHCSLHNCTTPPLFNCTTFPLRLRAKTEVGIVETTGGTPPHPARWLSHRVYGFGARPPSETRSSWRRLDRRPYRTFLVRSGEPQILSRIAEVLARSGGIRCSAVDTAHSTEA